VRSERAGESRFKRATANLFYRLINKLSEVPIPLDTGDFRLMDRKVVDVLNAMPERDRFIRGMVSWVGFRQCAHLYKRQPRFAGESKYPLWKMLKFATDGIVSFSSEPLRLASKLGFATIGLSVFGILYTLIVRLFTEEWVSGWAFIVVTILFFSGVQLFTLGILGEYVGRIYAEGKRRPLFVESEILERND
jgi:dolichol-phosphate mannosyltransferase